MHCYPFQPTSYEEKEGTKVQQKGLKENIAERQSKVNILLYPSIF